jgi:hypothetical protein
MHPSTGSSLPVVAQLDWDWELIFLVIVLSVLMGLGIWCIVWVRRWGQHDETLTPQQELASHRAMLEQGLLTQEEFDRLRTRLESTLRNQESGVRNQEATDH